MRSQHLRQHFQPLSAAILLLVSSQACAQAFDSDLNFSDGLAHVVNPAGDGPFTINSIRLSSGSSLTLGAKPFILAPHVDASTNLSDIDLNTGSTLIFDGTRFTGTASQQSINLQGTLNNPVTLRVENGADVKMHKIDVSAPADRSTLESAATIIADGPATRLQSEMNFSGPGGQYCPTYGAQRRYGYHRQRVAAGNRHH